MSTITSIFSHFFARKKIYLSACASLICMSHKNIFASPEEVSTRHSPVLSYSANPSGTRTLLFMNNPEFLWATKETCDLADESFGLAKIPCASSLFRIDTLAKGQFRAWWEHRNMMPFAIRSALLVSNSGLDSTIIEIEGDALENNSSRRGGMEFVELLNTTEPVRTIRLAPGERILLGNTWKKSIHPGNFFAGIVDFNILQGHVSLDEVVFRNEPAKKLKPSEYSSRTVWGVHESLVYKGISPVSSVILTGAEFQVNDDTAKGPLPVSYSMTDVVGPDHSAGFCSNESLPPCQGKALSKRTELALQTSWVTHIAPDPLDSNPKRKRAILDDLIELTLPGSASQCPSAWPMKAIQPEKDCVRMSAFFNWFLHDFQQWRLPNWGNWAVHYSHPVRIVNSGKRERVAVLRVTADGPSPLAYRGSGVDVSWRQAFLDPRSKRSEKSSLIIAKRAAPAGSTVELLGELILGGPGAGTLEHHIEILD